MGSPNNLDIKTNTGRWNSSDKFPKNDEVKLYKQVYKNITVWQIKCMDDLGNLHHNTTSE